MTNPTPNTKPTGARCRTCGGTPQHHVPSVLDPNGVGNPGHKIKPTEPVDDELSFLRNHSIYHSTELIERVKRVIKADRQQLLDRVEKITQRDFVHGESSTTFDEGRSYEQYVNERDLAKLRKEYLGDE